MKTVTLRYFAAFRDAAGTDRETVQSCAATLGALFAEQVERHAALHEEMAAKVALNDVLVDWEHHFADGDEVLFFPPVAGG
jgi:molybdopterin converting factor small subunit